MVGTAHPTVMTGHCVIVGADGVVVGSHGAGWGWMAHGLVPAVQWWGPTAHGLDSTARVRVPPCSDRVPRCGDQVPLRGRGSERRRRGGQQFHCGCPQMKKGSGVQISKLASQAATNSHTAPRPILKFEHPTPEHTLVTHERRPLFQHETARRCASSCSSIGRTAAESFAHAVSGITPVMSCTSFWSEHVSLNCT